MILLLFFFWADLSQWGQKQKKEINSQGLIKMFITQKLVNLTPSGQIQVTHKLIIPLIIPSPFFQNFRVFRYFPWSHFWGTKIKVRGWKGKLWSLACPRTRTFAEMVVDRLEHERMNRGMIATWSRHDRDMITAWSRYGRNSFESAYEFFVQVCVSKESLTSSYPSNHFRRPA